MTGAGGFSVRPLAPRDADGWWPLWAGYLAFYRQDVPDDVTEATFARLAAGREAGDAIGLVAVDADDAPVGFAHLLFHPSTWTAGCYCYLEDMFVARRGRAWGVGRALIEAAYAEADRRGAERVYWHAQEFNAPARSLYDQVGQRTSFVVYRR